ncbi:hypothetical protein PFUGPA_00986 [Plasmodium falciparum Palo Alto/Uganda]|uniref:Dolichol-phosphate mannosyltransferase subunit 3 n=2 Tax=Plasmodium falciparum TaxID=5833 RepID=W4J4M0_PLAFP|nr:hypothetical protein PFFVO_01212 [Plasmodium falciparum Vietnam Oak-Knoll (FVO)]ETW56969.1 hypothetical protein PFUGPA_00986 [Plasmodium falciparum Palo Alto/Uganda]
MDTCMKKIIPLYLVSALGLYAVISISISLYNFNNIPNGHEQLLKVRLKKKYRLFLYINNLIYTYNLFKSFLKYLHIYITYILIFQELHNVKKELQKRNFIFD